jgi:branched-chain amino acid transport system substrate-binding protein
VHADILKYVYAKGSGAGRKEDVGHVLYNRGMINAVLSLEAIRTAQGKYGKKSLTGEQVRWGIENLDIDAKRIEALGLGGMMQPLKVTCSDHEGVRRARIHQWTGSDWKFVSDWIEADNTLLRPMVDQAAANYAKEKGIKPVTCKT